MDKAISLLLLGLCLTACGRRLHPMEVSFWYWHTPFKLQKDDIATLREIGVRRLFVRGGTFTSNGRQAMLAMPQQWASPSKPFELVLVYNFDTGLLRHFSGFPIADFAARMASDISQSAANAERHGEQIEGVQLDVDCPTRLLPHYADLVRQFRLDLNRPKWSVSVTGLASWLGTDGVRQLARQVDFIAPQFYETRMGATANETMPVSDPQAIARDLPKAASLPVPVYAGLACYGHAILYDEKGRIAQMYRGLSPDDALRLPAFQYVDSRPLDDNGRTADQATYLGEDLLDLKAIRPGLDGRGLGYQIQYLLPTPLVVRNQLAAVRQSQPDNCAGIILYRMPEPGDAMALPLASVRDALQGAPEKLNLKLAIDARAEHWRSIEASYSADPENSVELRLTNTGNCPTAASPDAVQVEVKLPGTGVEQVGLGDFDSAALFHGDSIGELVPAGPADANVLVLRRGRLLPGQTISSGEIRAYGGGIIRAAWTAIGPGGFEVRRSIFHGPGANRSQ